MKRILQFCLILFMTLITACSNNETITSNNSSSSLSSSFISSNEDSKPTTNKNLIIYFSYSGNTKSVAESLNKKIDSYLVEIEPEIPYTKEDVDYLNPSSRSQTERKNDSRPNIKETTYSSYKLENYNNIFIGYPIWNGYAPMIIKTYIEHENNELLNKNIYTFSTSSSSSGNSVFNELKNKYNNLNFKDYLHLTSSQLKNVDNEINNKLTIWELNKMEENKKISLNFNNKKIVATIGINNPGNDLITRLKNGHITLTFNDFGGSEKITYPNPKLNIENENGYDPKAGDIVIYKPWNNIAIFYKDTVTYSSDLIYVGSIDEEYINLIEEINENEIITLKMEGK